MKKISNIFSLLYYLEKNIWGDKINPNKYLATSTILVCSLVGIFMGGGEYLSSMFDLDFRISLPIALAVITCMLGINIAESIIASKSAKTAIWRALFMIGMIGLAVAVSVVASVIVLLIITVVIAGYLILVIISGGLSGLVNSGGSGSIRLDDGTELKSEKGLMGEKYYRSTTTGDKYETNDGGRTFRKK